MNPDSTPAAPAAGGGAARPPSLSLMAMLYYGLFGLPLAMLALPIYVYVPQFYAQRGALTLAVIGAALLAARTVAAFIDPLLGWWISRAGGAYRRSVLIALPLLIAGYAMLFHPPSLTGVPALCWFLLSLMLVYTGFSLATIAHQSWGAALTQLPGERSKLAAVRESCGLLGVMTAAVLPAVFNYDALSYAFAATLLAGAVCLLYKAPRPRRAVDDATAAVPLRFAELSAPFRRHRFRALFLVLMVNGVAASIPATLFLFFAEDRLKLGSNAGLFLLLYFASAAASMAAWPLAARRFGEARAWVASMLLTAAVFVWAYWLGPGDAVSFGVICALSGLALGADLALPPALLAGVIASAGDSGRREAAYFGVWNWGVQMTLALAAGVSLPVLEWLGYMPGTGQGLGALSLAYALLPCCLKLIAAALLWRAPLRDC